LGGQPKVGRQPGRFPAVLTFCVDTVYMINSYFVEKNISSATYFFSAIFLMPESVLSE
jgi:hypothetical protein